MRARSINRAAEAVLRDERHLSPKPAVPRFQPVLRRLVRWRVRARLRPMPLINCSLFLVQSATQRSTTFSLPIFVHQTDLRSELRRSLRNELNLTFVGASRCATARQKSADNIPEFLFTFSISMLVYPGIFAAHKRGNSDLGITLFE